MVSSTIPEWHVAALHFSPNAFREWLLSTPRHPLVTNSSMAATWLRARSMLRAKALAVVAAHSGNWSLEMALRSPAPRGMRLRGDITDSERPVEIYIPQDDEQLVNTESAAYMGHWVPRADFWLAVDTSPALMDLVRTLQVVIQQALRLVYVVSNPKHPELGQTMVEHAFPPPAWVDVNSDQLRRVFGDVPGMGRLKNLILDECGDEFPPVEGTYEPEQPSPEQLLRMGVISRDYHHAGSSLTVNPHEDWMMDVYVNGSHKKMSGSRSLHAG
jgi:hypothetical protein